MCDHCCHHQHVVHSLRALSIDAASIWPSHLWAGSHGLAIIMAAHSGVCHCCHCQHGHTIVIIIDMCGGLSINATWLVQLAWWWHSCSCCCSCTGNPSSCFFLPLPSLPLSVLDAVSLPVPSSGIIFLFYKMLKLNVDASSGIMLLKQQLECLS